VRVLRHEYADGSWHYDWLVAMRRPTDADDRCVRAWRVQVRPDQMETGSQQTATPLPAHRAFYLGLRGHVDLSWDRGRVTADVAGTLEKSVPREFHVRWDDGSRMVYRVDRVPGSPECIQCLRSESAPNESQS
jgi:hypothetical protein